MLSLKLLGGASIERSGRTLTGRASRGRQLALLALLARRPLSRDKAGASESAFPLAEVLVATLELDRGGPDGGLAGEPDPSLRYLLVRDELIRRLEADPALSHVALIGEPPPWYDPDIPFELDEGPSTRPSAAPPGAVVSAATGDRVGRSVVSPELLAAFDIHVVAGRALDARDTRPEPTAALVNQAFVDVVLGGASPLDRRIRFPRREDPSLGTRSPRTTEGVPWYTIVGVIPNFPPPSPWSADHPEAKVYLPLEAGAGGPVSIAVRVRGGDAQAFAGRFRRVAADVDPMLRLAALGTLGSGGGTGQRSLDLTLPIVALVLSVLLLAIAGLYALISFTVERRHREIGIRTALGAAPHRVLGGILARASRQVALGVAAGLLLAEVANRMTGGEIMAGRGAVLLPSVAVLMSVVGVLAAWGPARRALAIQPTDALRAE
jgi:hypothetical protein